MENRDISGRVADLRDKRAAAAPTGECAAAALAGLARLWQDRLDRGWRPPAGSAYPWPMVRFSLEALLPGMASADEWLSRARDGGSNTGPDLIALILAGNTPLLAWPALCASLLAGSAAFVKMSRDETLWPRLFVESLAEVDPELASLIYLDVWPGTDPRTTALLRSADAAIAYGGDAALASLRAAAPDATPFLGFGHALSVGIVTNDRPAAAAFAYDVLLYDQGGCLSPHAIFVEGNGDAALAVAETLAAALPSTADALAAPPGTDPAVAREVRQARDLALFSPGVTLHDDPSLRWTVIAHAEAMTMEAPVGHGVVHVIPLPGVAAGLGSALGAARGRVSAAGIAGEASPELLRVLEREGVSRLCPAGRMQAPPLDWPNGGRDLLAELLGRGPSRHREAPRLTAG